MKLKLSGTGRIILQIYVPSVLMGFGLRQKWRRRA
jgi:hypothetical protein